MTVWWYKNVNLHHMCLGPRLNLMQRSASIDTCSMNLLSPDYQCPDDISQPFWTEFTAVSDELCESSDEFYSSRASVSESADIDRFKDAEGYSHFFMDESCFDEKRMFQTAHSARSPLQLSYSGALLSLLHVLSASPPSVSRKACRAQWHLQQRLVLRYHH